MTIKLENRIVGATATNASYDMRVVAFLDILGFRSLVKTLKDKSTLNNIVNALNRIGREKTEYSEYDSIRASTFSDSVAISSWPNDVYSVLRSCGILQAELLYFGICVRGGVSLGHTHHVGGVLFGEGLIDAYDLESKAAVYPRILLSFEIVALIDSYIEAGSKEYMRPHYLELRDAIVYDHDGLPFLDCFSFDLRLPKDGFNYIRHLSGTNTRMKYLNEISKHIELGVNSSDNMGHKAKWNWLSNRYDIALKNEREKKNSAESSWL